MLFELYLGLSAIIAIALIASLHSIYRINKIWFCLSSLGIAIVAIIMYLYLGNSQALISYKRMQSSKNVLSEQNQWWFHHPKILLNRLSQLLAKRPRDTHGWYLYGRLALAIHDYKQARYAFLHARQLAPDDINIQLNYIIANYISSKYNLSKADKQKLYVIVKNNPSQRATALSILADAAYRQRDYGLAIKLWEQLLPILPANSQQGIELRKLIVVAQRKLN